MARLKPGSNNRLFVKYSRINFTSRYHFSGRALKWWTRSESKNRNELDKQDIVFPRFEGFNRERNKLEPNLYFDRTSLANSRRIIFRSFYLCSNVCRIFISRSTRRIKLVRPPMRNKFHPKGNRARRGGVGVRSTIKVMPRPLTSTLSTRVESPPAARRSSFAST